MMPSAVLPDGNSQVRTDVEVRYRVEGVEIRYRIDGFSEDWTIPEIPVPEAPWHDLCLQHFKALLVAWVARTRREAVVFRDVVIGVQREKPRWGFNPDVCVVEPPPPRATELDSVKLWEEGHVPPTFSFEAVSRNHPFKDYSTVPEKCGLLGVRELVVFDPLLVGPRVGGGPWLLQLWQRAEDGGFLRTYAGKGPVFSAYLGGYLHANRRGRLLSIAAQRSGEELWLTHEDEARRREDEARRREDEARRREDEARARIAELEAELARLRDG